MLGRQVRRAALLLAVLPWLADCGTGVLYQDSGVPNLYISANAYSGQFLAATLVYLDIRRVTPDCNAEYAGSLKLFSPLAFDRAPTKVHLPEERLSELVFKFRTAGGNMSAQTSYSTLLRPRAGHTYEAAVTYDAGLYDVEIREIGPHGAASRKIEHRALVECHRA